MKKYISKIGFVCGSLLVLSSCAQILGDVLFPNQCIRCEVKDWANSYWTSSECGGGKDKLETECKARAYDIKVYNSSAECSCEYYTGSE